MGFSISGSAAIVFAGMFIAFGIFYGATSNSFERVSDAQSGQSDQIVDQKNIDIEIVRYEERSDTEHVIAINNTGSKTLSVSETDLIVDNTYLSDWESSTVYDSDGNDKGDTDLWAPGERLEITISTDPGRVKVVTEYGVSDTVIVSGETKVVF